MGKEFLVALKTKTKSMVHMMIQAPMPDPPAMLLDVVVTDKVPEGAVKVIGGRYCLVSDMHGLVKAVRMYRNRDKRLWYHTEGWYEVVR